MSYELPTSSIGTAYWKTTGNTGLTDGVNNYIGVAQNIPLYFVQGVSAPIAGILTNGTTVFGFDSGNSISGTGNSFFGSQSGKNSNTKNYNTCIGMNTETSGASTDNCIVLGYGALANAANQFVIGTQTHVKFLLNTPAIGHVLTATATDGTANWQPAPTSGTYTPTLTGVTNVTATTARKCTYMRVGNTVTVAGQMDIDPTGAGTTVVGISLPVASNFGTAYEAGGAGHAPAVAGHGASIYADATNNRVELSYVDSIGSNNTMTFTFTYEIV